jgi:recombinational DNA repair protein (RecF pathway)
MKRRLPAWGSVIATYSCVVGDWNKPVGQIEQVEVMASATAIQLAIIYATLALASAALVNEQALEGKRH